MYSIRICYQIFVYFTHWACCMSGISLSNVCFNKRAYTVKVKLAVTLFYIRIKVFITKTVICPFLPDLWISLCNSKLCAIRFTNALVSLGIMGMAVVTLKVPFLLKDGTCSWVCCWHLLIKWQRPGGREQGVYHLMELYSLFTQVLMIHPHRNQQ